MFMNFQDGDRVLEYIKNSPTPKARLEFQVTHLGAKPAPKVASYSSRGPSQSCPFILKPDLMAPGALILASWPQKLLVTEINSFSNFNIISGTSMSCPHAAGVAALTSERGTPQMEPCCHPLGHDDHSRCIRQHTRAHPRYR
ncbi:hypothetical protein KY290_009944 [Solanum tuberosum]|uniref:Peptidase S8/S53 domain-containing protein n=1 Tax=Solanum tuberosum TaxID=4113 RepID=A0ABQ7VWC7_SOLTU|nr:hypothetical protein KY290_009944 [Solanum tuberosum]